jgi:hypothetical protein
MADTIQLAVKVKCMRDPLCAPRAAGSAVVDVELAVAEHDD